MCQIHPHFTVKALFQFLDPIHYTPSTTLYLSQIPDATTLYQSQVLHALHHTNKRYEST